MNGKMNDTPPARRQIYAVAPAPEVVMMDEPDLPTVFTVGAEETPAIPFALVWGSRRWTAAELQDVVGQGGYIDFAGRALSVLEVELQGLGTRPLLQPVAITVRVVPGRCCNAIALTWIELP